LKVFITLITLVFNLLTFAKPLKVSAIFLSSDIKTSFNTQDKKLKLYGMLAERTEKCVKMGDHCFHPQYGIVKEGEEKESKGVSSPDVEIKHVNLDDVNELKCNKGTFFDFYCGQIKKEKKAQTGLEVWVDTSSSMRRVDYTKSDNYCERRFALSSLQKKCKSKFTLHGFDTGKRELLGLGQVCRNVGTNDGRRLTKWIKSSNAKHLVVVTDIDEFNGVFREYLQLIDAEIIGVGTKSLTSKDLTTILSRYSTSCNK